MEHSEYNSAAMGRHYHGHNPCIDPLSMAELMIRLENRRTNSLLTQKPCNPAAKLLANLLKLIK
jgi:hypothetical protein